MSTRRSPNVLIVLAVALVVGLVAVVLAAWRWWPSPAPVTAPPRPVETAKSRAEAMPEPNLDEVLRRAPARPSNAAQAASATGATGAGVGVLSDAGGPPVQTPHPAVLVLDSEGRPLLEGKPVSPDSPEYKELVPSDMRLPTRGDVERILQNYDHDAIDCFRAEDGGDKGGVLASRFFFRGGDAPPLPDTFAVADAPAAACLHQRMSQGGSRDGALVTSRRGSWVWSIYHEYQIPPLTPP